MAYTMYTPLNVWLDPASVTDVVAYIQNYLSENTIYSEEEIEELIHDYLEEHPELIGGVQSVNGKTGTVVLTASDINTTNNVTIESVLASLSSQISSIASSVATNTTNITNLTGRVSTAETDISNLKSSLTSLEDDITGYPVETIYSETNKTISSYWASTGFIPELNHTYALVCGKPGLAFLGTLNTSATWIQQSSAAGTVKTLTVTDVTNIAGLYIGINNPPQTDSYSVVDVTNNTELLEYLQSEAYITDDPKWYGGSIKNQIGKLSITLKTILSDSTPIYVGGTASVTFTNNIISGSYTSATGYVCLRQNLIANSKYLIVVKETNNNTHTITRKFATLKTTYTWLNANMLSYSVNAGGSITRALVLTPSENAWFALANATTYADDVSATVYIYNVNSLSENQLKAIEAYDYSALADETTLTSSDSAATAIISENSKNTVSRFNNVWFCGDSITDYRWYPPVVAKALNASYYVDGHPGEPISGCSSGIVADPTLLNGYDLLTVFAGTNDFAGNKTLGDANSTADTTTTCGSIKLIIETIQQARPDIRIIFFTPLPRGKIQTYPEYGGVNGLNLHLDDYVDAIVNICSIYHIPVINLYNIIGWNQFNITSKTLDNLHPTQIVSETELAPIMAEQIKIL